MAVGFFTFLYLVFWSFLLDEPLSAEAEYWLNWQPEVVPENENAAVWLMGLPASKDDDVMAVGRLRYQAMQTADDGTYFPYQDYPADRWIAEAPIKELCGRGKETCIRTYFSSCEKAEAMVAANKLILDRYIQLMSYQRISTGAGADPDFFTVDLMRSGQHINLFRISKEAMCGRPVDSLEMLFTNIKSIRHHLTIADSMAYKLGLFTALENNYHFLSEMIRRKVIGSDDIDYSMEVFEPLAVDERSLRLPLGRQLKIDFSLILNKFYGEQVGLLEKTYIGLFFKRNIYFNRGAYGYSMLIDASEKSAHEYRKVEFDSELYEPRLYMVHNIIGEYIAIASMPRFVDVAGEFHKVNLLINLTAIMLYHQDLIEAGTFGELPGKLRNPYDQSAPFFNESKDKLCFGVPGENEAVCTRIR